MVLPLTGTASEDRFTGHSNVSVSVYNNYGINGINESVTNPEILTETF